ncbi:MAG: TraR/DksA C4-type zinc finger protein [Balneolaceae bacterium]
MTNAEKNQLIEIIKSQIIELKSDIVELVELTKPIPLDASIGRISRMDAINNKTINESSLREKKKMLQRLEKALENSTSKEFGICTKCGKEIPFGRLEFMPHTTRCVTCIG